MMWALNIILKHNLGLERKQQSFHDRPVRALESGTCIIMFFSVSYSQKIILLYITSLCACKRTDFFLSLIVDKVRIHGSMLLDSPFSRYPDF